MALSIPSPRVREVGVPGCPGSRECRPVRQVSASQLVSGLFPVLLGTSLPASPAAAPSTASPVTGARLTNARPENRPCADTLEVWGLGSVPGGPRLSQEESLCADEGPRGDAAGMWGPPGFGGGQQHSGEAWNGKAEEAAQRVSVSQAEVGSVVSDGREPSGKVRTERCSAGLATGRWSWQRWGRTPALCCLLSPAVRFPPSADTSTLQEVAPGAAASEFSAPCFPLFHTQRPHFGFQPSSRRSGRRPCLGRLGISVCPPWCHGNRGCRLCSSNPGPGSVPVSGRRCQPLLVLRHHDGRVVQKDSDVVSNVLLILGFIAMANTVCR